MSELICWHSKRAGFDVLKNTLGKLRKRSISKVIYLIQDAVSEERIKQIENEFQVAIELVPVELKDPANHLEIYQKMESQVLPKLDLQTKYFLNISPGTPAMHAVWLFLYTGGALPSGIELVSTQYNPETKRRSCKPVRFPVTTYLSEIRNIESMDISKARFDPSRLRSIELKSALEKLLLYARLPKIPILILGERGTGKTRIVETHFSTLKDGKEVVVVPCGGLDSTLSDSLLFGHKKGSFSGAIDDRKGILKEADGKILFLDEIQDLPKTTQRKLVRVFQDEKQKFRRLGDDEEIYTDVELVCASNHDIASLRSHLDHDFYDRISYFTVEIPPLRRCREDIRLFWNNIWNEALPGKPPESEDLNDIFKNASFERNFRDLKRLALLLRAWSTTKQSDYISSAILEWQNWLTEETGHPKFGQGTRSDRLKKHKLELAGWAVSEYGSITNAAKALKCSKSIIEKDYAEFKKSADKG